MSEAEHFSEYKNGIRPNLVYTQLTIIFRGFSIFPYFLLFFINVPCIASRTEARKRKFKLKSLILVHRPFWFSFDSQ